MTTPTLRKAAQAALEALESLQGGCTDSNDGTVEAITVWCPEVIDALQSALAQPVPDAPSFDAEGFYAFVLRELPDDTIIGKGQWWADRLTKCAQWFVKPTVAAHPQPAPHNAIASALRGHIHTLRLSGRNDGMVEDMARAVVALEFPATAQPAPQPLTDAQIMAACSPLGWAQLSPMEVARAIERAHGIVPAPTTGEGQ